MIQERYRKDYLGEFVIVKSVWRNGAKEQEREWVDNPIENQHISGRAAIIGRGVSKNNFDIQILERHRGGLLGNKRLQTYAAEGVWQQMHPNFYISNNNEELAKILLSDYSEDNIVYTSAKKCISNPGKFYLIPYNANLVDIATATWLAAFDGHQEIFFIGVDGTDDQCNRDEQQIADINKVIQAYAGVRFYSVTDGEKPPSEWRQNPNFSIMTYAQWKNYCDV